MSTKSRKMVLNIPDADETIGPWGRDQTAPIMTAALLSALEGECDCDACKLLRRLARRMKKVALKGVMEDAGDDTE